MHDHTLQPAVKSYPERLFGFIPLPLWLSVALLMLVFFNAPGQSKKYNAPPNLVQLYDSLFIDQTEVNNMHYLEFLHAVRRDSGNAYYKKMQPDTTAWDDVNFYVRDPALVFYPIVAITYEQANAYCIWRSNVANLAAVNNHPNPKTTFIFRLPTEEEWVTAAAANLDTTIYSYGFKEFEIRSTLMNDPRYYYDRIENKGTMSLASFDKIFNQFRRYGREPFFNCLKMFFSYFEYGAKGPLSTIDQSNNAGIFREKYAYNYKSTANSLGISGMIGNVSEMINTNGLAKGGSWAHPLEACKISKWQRYDKPAAWLGFRCVCIVSVR